MKLVYGKDHPDADVVIVYGNCQAPLIAWLLSVADSAQSGRVYIAGLNHTHPGHTPVPLDPKLLARCVLYIEQLDERAEVPERTALREGIPPRTPKIIFPPMGMHCFWPFETIEPRVRYTEKYPFGRFPIGDLIGLQIAKQNLPGEAAFDAYMKLSTERMPDLAKRLDWDLERMSARDHASDVQIGSYLSMTCRHQHLFWTSGHLASQPVALLACRLYEALHPLLGGDLDEGLDRMQDAVDQWEGMGPVQLPIHPLVAERLRLDFVQPDRTYDWSGEQWNFRDYMIRYLSYDENWGHLGQ